MDETKFNTLVQMIAALSARVEKLAQAQKNFVTKDDLKRFATKNAVYATSCLRNALQQQASLRYATTT